MLILVLPVVFVIQVFVFRPYFGNMDDSNFLISAANNDPISYSHALGWRPGSGFILHTSMVITWPVYALGSAFGPTVYFAANALLTITLILFAAYSLTKLLDICTPTKILTFVSIAFLWPYSAELLFFPSLSEKGVILGVSVLFLWIHFTRSKRSSLIFWSTFALATLLAFATKTHIALFVPAIVTALWMVNWGRGAPNSLSRLVGATVGLFLLGVGILWLAIEGDYSSGTQGESDMSFMSDRRFLLLVALAAAYGTYLIYRAVTREFRAIEFAPLLMVIPFIASFSVWAVRNYYLSVVSIGVAAMAAVIVANFKSKNVGPIAALICLAAALVWIAWRVPQIYQPLASVQDFLVSTEAQLLSQQREVVGVLCSEAPTHFNRYSVSEGATNLQFEWTADRLEDFEFVLGDDRLCPFNPDPADWELKWESPRGAGYSLYRNRTFAS
jgi:hypothetical protein